MSIRGRFCWYELMTAAPEAAKAFYAEVIGWKVQPWGPPEMGYAMIANAEGPVGGIADISTDPASTADTRPQWLAYFGTLDVDATVAQARSLGATVVVPPTDIPEVGRFAVLKDPQGATFSPFRPAPTSAPMPEMTPRAPGTISWHELMSSDADAGFAFYAALFGWVQAGEMDMGPMGTYRMFGLSADQPLGGMMNKPSDMPASAWNYYITVANIHTALAKVRANGGTVINGPNEVPGNDLAATCIDPQGALFSVFQVGNAPA